MYEVDYIENNIIYSRPPSYIIAVGLDCGKINLYKWQYNITPNDWIKAYEIDRRWVFFFYWFNIILCLNYNIGDLIEFFNNQF